VTASPDLRCPSCAATETMLVKTAWAWSVQQVGWPWNRRLAAVKRPVGDCVVCLRCDQPFVVTAAGPFIKQTPRVGKAVVPSYQPNSHGDDLKTLQAAINRLPDEPE